MSESLFDGVRGKVVYVVDKWLDQIRERPAERSRTQNDVMHYEYFVTEKEARAFIVKRAKEKLRRAEKDLLNAQRRVRKCESKFGFRLYERDEQMNLQSAAPRRLRLAVELLSGVIDGHADYVSIRSFVKQHMDYAATT